MAIFTVNSSHDKCGNQQTQHADFFISVKSRISRQRLTDLSEFEYCWEHLQLCKYNRPTQLRSIFKRFKISRAENVT